MLETIILSCCSLLLCCVFFFNSNRRDERSWQGGRRWRGATAREQTSQSEEKSALTDREEVKHLRKGLKIIPQVVDGGLQDLFFSGE